ncbi:MAG: CPBP family intramembrane metalloprotease [Lactobacillus sp.]|nr:CPBP family intramembrane metalloprotease [Lactobacillus sp.]
MNTPSSKEGNLIRYAVYVVSYIIAALLTHLTVFKFGIKMWSLVLLAIIYAVVFSFIVKRFKKEEHFFENTESGQFTDYYKLIIIMSIIIGVVRIACNYLQLYGMAKIIKLQTYYAGHETDALFWFLIITLGILLPILQQYLATGFLFNYLFRGNNKTVAYTGSIFSGLLFSVLNFQFSFGLFIANWIIGIICALAFLKTQKMAVAMYLAAVSGILFVIML